MSDRPADLRSLAASWAGWAVLAAVLVVALAVGARSDGPPPTAAERTYELGRTIRCPQCVGQSVSESDVAISREMRTDIARRIEAGETDEEIRAAYVAAYGEDILLTPPSSGTSLLVWVLPVVAAVGGVVGLVVVVRRGRRGETAAEEATDADRELVARALEARDRP